MNNMSQCPYSLETIGHFGRIINAAGNDVLLLGSVLAPDYQQRVDELLALVNLLARLRAMLKDAVSLRDEKQWLFERCARGKPVEPQYCYAVEWFSQQVQALNGYLMRQGFNGR